MRKNIQRQDRKQAEGRESIVLSVPACNYLLRLDILKLRSKRLPRYCNCKCGDWRCRKRPAGGLGALRQQAVPVEGQRSTNRYAISTCAVRFRFEVGKTNAESLSVASKIVDDESSLGCKCTFRASPSWAGRSVSKLMT